MTGGRDRKAGGTDEVPAGQTVAWRDQPLIIGSHGTLCLRGHCPMACTASHNASDTLDPSFRINSARYRWPEHR